MSGVISGFVICLLLCWSLYSIFIFIFGSHIDLIYHLESIGIKINPKWFIVAKWTFIAGASLLLQKIWMVY